MFYRATKHNFDQDRYDDILAWGETVRSTIEGIDGLLFVDTFVSAPGEGFIVGGWESEEAFNTASEAIASVFADMAQFLTSEPHTYTGTVDLAYGRNRAAAGIPS